MTSIDGEFTNIFALVREFEEKASIAAYGDAAVVLCQLELAVLGAGDSVDVAGFMRDVFEGSSSSSPAIIADKKLPIVIQPFVDAFVNRMQGIELGFVTVPNI